MNKDVSDSQILGLRSNRWCEIDCVKALSILTVILIHCNANGFKSAPTHFQSFVNDWTRFAVPAFLFSAGFLFNKNPAVNTIDVGWRAALRIIPPYLCCSLIWIAYAVTVGRLPANLMAIAKPLMIGSANGIYYFVFVISYLYAFGLVLRNLPAPLVKWAWGLSFTGMLSYYLFWPHLVLPSFTFEAMFRSPLVHTLPFLTGWVASQHYPSIRPFLSRVKSRYVATMLGIDLAVVMLLQNFDNEIKSRELLIQLHIYLWLTAVMVLSIQMKLNSRWITYFSLSSYGIYLTHIIFVDQFNRLLHKYESPSLPLQIILSCVLVTGLTVLLLEIVKRSAGRYAEFLVGVKA